jgi:hypothetical protein
LNTFWAANLAALLFPQIKTPALTPGRLCKQNIDVFIRLELPQSRLLLFRAIQEMIDAH